MGAGGDALRTSFGSLRRWRASDAGSLARHANNPAVARTMSDAFPSPYGPDDARRFLALAATQAGFFAICTADDEAVGGIGVAPGADIYRLTGEVGYWLAEPFWGRGIVAEALTVFTPFAFKRFGLVRLYARPFATNAASGRVLEKAGYALEARLRANVVKNGAVLDQLVYAALAPGARPGPA
ncbi:MAG TPA: GNAT family N-acetyltransferase [Polyangiaceae bacterium]|nr:GNAT family N-acetyltransferase [Polyangiaceae bacterium]